MSCLFCNLSETNYKPESHIDYICGRCVILLTDADQADLKKSYSKALDKGYQRKAKAIKSFIIPEGKNGRKPNKSVKRNFNRERAARPIRDKKRFSVDVTNVSWMRDFLCFFG